MTYPRSASKHCSRGDQDLLLLAHGALPLWPRLRAQLHLRRCAECRKRLARLTQTSALLASAVRGPALPPWSPADAVARTDFPPALPVPVWVVVLVLAVLVSALCFSAWENFGSHPAAHSVVGGCLPNLPNSRCR